MFAVFVDSTANIYTHKFNRMRAYSMMLLSKSYDVLLVTGGCTAINPPVQYLHVVIDSVQLPIK